jgi:hypothetical protein
MTPRRWRHRGCLETTFLLACRALYFRNLTCAKEGSRKPQPARRTTVAAFPMVVVGKLLKPKRSEHHVAISYFGPCFQGPTLYVFDFTIQMLDPNHLGWILIETVE